MSRKTLHLAMAPLLDTARLRHRTAASAVTEALRVAIITGILPAGTSLRQEMLATDLGISRMPIRESLRSLAAEGLIVSLPHCGAVVAKLRPEDILEIAEMRVALECLALRRAFADIDNLRLDKLDTILSELDGADSLVSRNVLNRHFHCTLYGVSTETRLRRHIDMLYDSYDRFLLLEHSQLDRRARSQSEHRSILEACRKQDLSLALHTLQAHIEGGASELVEYLVLHQTFAEFRVLTGNDMEQLEIS